MVEASEIVEVRDIVKDKYGAAALRVQAGGGSSCCGGAAFQGSCDPITSNLYDALQEGELPETTRRPWPSSKPVKRCSIWAPEEVSMSCFQRGALAPQAKLMAST